MTGSFINILNAWTHFPRCHIHAYENGRALLEPLLLDVLEARFPKLWRFVLIDEQGASREQRRYRPLKSVLRVHDMMNAVEKAR